MYSTKRLKTLVAGVLLACSLAPAQTTSTEILGTVIDSTGSLVPDAKVTLLRLATGERRDTVTTTSGDYSFPLIEVGEYTVRVTKQGFTAQEKTGIVVQLQQKARVNFDLTVGESTQTVTVAASAVELKTDDATVGGVVENKRIAELPLNGRNVGGLAVLVPGVQYGARFGITDTGNAAAGYPIPGRLVSVSANGQRDTDQHITLDGVKATDPIDNAMNFTPSLDAIEEFKVQTSSYSAEFGMNNGAYVTIVLKSGTNQFHGTFFEFLRNDAMDASDYFLNFQVPQGTPRTPKNRLRRNQFGASFNGPVFLPKIYNGKDRTFWMFTYEGDRETDETVQSGYFFPQAFRNGDFSALSNPAIVNGAPVRGPVLISDPLTGTPFPGNIVPPSMINKNAQNFINKFQPLPMFQQADILANNVQTPVPSVIQGDQYLFRVDHNFRSQDRVFVHLIADRSTYQAGALNPTFNVFETAPSTNMSSQYVHIFSPRTMNEFRYGLNTNGSTPLNPRASTSFDLNSLGIGNFLVGGVRPLTSFEAGLPNTLLGNETDSGFGFKYGTQNEFSENLSIIRGSHGFKFGFGYMRTTGRNYASNNPRGILTSSANEGGYAMAGFLMGYLDASTAPEGLPEGNIHQGRYSAYALDDWKVSRKLTVELGLRWDLMRVPTDDTGNLRNLRFDILTQASNGQMLPTLWPAPNSKNFPFINSDNRYFMPRVGIAYRATDKWVVRLSSGWFVNAQQLNNFFVLDRNPPAAGAPSFQSSTQTGSVINYQYAGRAYSLQTREFTPGSTILTLNNAFPGQGPISPITNLYSMPIENRMASDVQWSFDIQRALPLNTFLTIGYVGSKTSHLDETVTDNAPLPNPNTNINVVRPYQAFVSLNDPTGPTVARGLGSVRLLPAWGNGSYEALQTSVEKRYRQGLLMNFTYVFSKAIGEGYERNGNAVYQSFQDPYNLRMDRARYQFDTTHNATISFVYEIPFTSNLKGVAGSVLHGWQVNGIITMHTGYPFGLAGGSLNTGDPSRPDRIADGRLGSQANRQLWFNPLAFQRTDCNVANRPDLCHYGSAANDILVGPGMRNLDGSIFRNFQIRRLGDAGRLQFRLEAFNATNTPHFGQPNGIGFVSATTTVPDGPQQGVITKLLAPMRTVQLGLKLYF